jgi:hypothetical protein
MTYVQASLGSTYIVSSLAALFLSALQQKNETTIQRTSNFLQFFSIFLRNDVQRIEKFLAVFPMEIGGFGM